MAFYVGFHAFLGVEGVVADGALIHFLPVVGHLVELQHVVVAEGFTAYLAGVGLFSCVSPRMHLQKNLILKGVYAIIF